MSHVERPPLGRAGGATPSEVILIVTHGTSGGNFESRPEQEVGAVGLFRSLRVFLPTPATALRLYLLLRWIAPEVLPG
jgi:hypothetical protein